MSLETLTVEAEAGNAEAQYRLGVLLILGTSGEQNRDAAQRWLIRASANGYPGARELAIKLTRLVELDEMLLRKRETRIAHLQDKMVTVGTNLQRWWQELFRVRPAMLLHPWNRKIQQSRRLTSADTPQRRRALNPHPEDFSLRDLA